MLDRREGEAVYACLQHMLGKISHKVVKGKVPTLITRREGYGPQKFEANAQSTG
jgi:hypothetical protein